MGAFRLLEEGKTYIDLPEELRRYRSDVFTDKYKRLSWGSLCRSITAHIAKDGYWYIHPEQHRTLSIREAAQVQGFPDRVPVRRDTDAPVPTDRQRRTDTLGEAVGRSCGRRSVDPTRALEPGKRISAIPCWRGMRRSERGGRHGAE